MLNFKKLNLKESKQQILINQITKIDEYWKKNLNIIDPTLVQTSNK